MTIDLKELSLKELSSLETQIHDERRRRKQKEKDCMVDLPSYMDRGCINCDFRLRCFDENKSLCIEGDVCPRVDGERCCDICLEPCN
jgi:hypothetical protein